MRIGEGGPLVTRPSKEDRVDPKLLTYTWLQQVTQNQHFRALAEFFASVGYLHLVPQPIREEQRPVVDALGAAGEVWAPAAGGA